MRLGSIFLMAILLFLVFAFSVHLVAFWWQVSCLLVNGSEQHCARAAFSVHC